MDNKKFNFFLSYSRDADMEIIDKLKSILESFGFSIWYDKEEVILGHDIYNDLYSILNECKSWNGILTIIDKTYLTKDWCLRELDYAIENNLKIYPILLFLTKQELPSKYKKLKNINLCTIRRTADLNYAVYKIIYRFLTDYLSTAKYNNAFISNLILDELVFSYRTGNKNDESIIFRCDNIAMCINYLLNNSNLRFDQDESIIFTLIHDIVKKYYILGKTNKLQIKIITKATDCLLTKYYSS